MAINLALLGQPITSISSSVTLGFDVGNTTPPGTLLVTSASAGSTITLPPVTLSASTVGTSTNDFAILNLAAQPVTLAVGSGVTIYGSSATLAQNAAVRLVSDAANNRWYRLTV